ncbi:hypothetical protein CARUB_v10022185mg, partial [Capsella rubella]
NLTEALRKKKENKNPNMGQDKQVKKDSPLYEQSATILASSQNEKLVEIEKDKRLALIDAWEENEKENLEVEKAEYSKKYKKKIPEIEKIAEAKREKIEKQKEQESIKVEKMSEKLIATPSAYPPNSKTCGCF